MDRLERWQRGMGITTNLKSEIVQGSKHQVDFVKMHFCFVEFYILVVMNGFIFC